MHVSGPAIRIASACYVRARVTLLVDVCGMEWDGMEPNDMGALYLGLFIKGVLAAFGIGSGLDPWL